MFLDLTVVYDTLTKVGIVYATLGSETTTYMHKEVKAKTPYEIMEAVRKLREELLTKGLKKKAKLETQIGTAKVRVLNREP